MRNRRREESSGPVVSAPLIVGVASDSSESSNKGTFSAILPTGIQNGDFGFAVFSSGNNADDPLLTGLDGWTIESGPHVYQTFNVGHLLRRTMQASDSGTSMDIVVAGIPNRGVLAVVIARSGTPVVSPVLSSTSTSVNIGVPGVTPPEDDCMLLHMCNPRFNSSTGPSIQHTSGWTERYDINEGRAASVNYGGFAQTKQLSGQGSVAQPATVAIGSVACNEHAWTIALPPKVT